jgi:hypothetical protein
MRSLRLAWVALAGATLLLGCFRVSPRFATGEAAALTGEGLRQLELSGFRLAWARPGVSFAGYDGVWLRYRDIAYEKPPGRIRAEVYGTGGDNYALSDGLYERLSSAMREIFEEELQDGLRKASGEAPGVLDTRVGMVDLIVHTPLDRVAGEDNIYVQSVATVTVLVDVHDAATGELILRVAERVSVAPASGRAMQANAGAAIFETRRLLRDFAIRVRRLLQAMKTTELS